MEETVREQIKYAAQIIRNGGLVAFPTETVYGLGADGLNPVAVAKIFEVKNRPTFNPLILHIENEDRLISVCNIPSNKVYDLIQEFWPGPLTLVLPKKPNVPEIVTGGFPNVGVRMPDNLIALELIKESDTPIAAPSANLFGHLSPTRAGHVQKQFGDKIDMILDGGKCSVGIESTILLVEEEEVTLLRPGGIPLESLREVIGEITLFPKKTDRPNSPGQLAYHYSPQTPLRILTIENIEKYKDEKIGAIFFKGNDSKFKFEKEIILSRSGSLSEAAANLFSTLHKLDELQLGCILIEPIPQEGLGVALMDRIQKAIAKYEMKQIL
ncbi:MAG: threonylcarbamoyl-AMP synthase [Ignavibacteria bacterium]|nr:threonylcarbamoyl-AMP synthase [Ignavibacteria bacterium]PIS45328.1 MAG: threonylcarbamoyl-AMP synthase [Ignavibacteria bacterium CG08_land_8_20_14_0_20_37_9]PIX93899.1 MAG: threonylcarbamoyl-AMP synthase [Ignavibacteria bacterium CG_4_10_14_3_um_filter_37_18]